MELGPLGAPGGSRGFVWIVCGIRGAFVVGDVDELEDEGTAGDDAAAAREEIPADDVFKDGGLAGGLRANDDLGTRVRISSVVDETV